MNKSRWDEILTVAARLFRSKGYRATTMDDIAGELNVTKPALYYYIENKHDLLYAICVSAIERLMEGVREIMSGPGESGEKLRRLIFWHVNMFSEHGDVTTVYLAEEGELQEDKRAFIRSLSREFESSYRELLQREIAEGRFRDLDVPMVVRGIAGMCNWLFGWYRPEGQASADDIAEVFYDLIVKGCEKR